MKKLTLIVCFLSLLITGCKIKGLEESQAKPAKADGAAAVPPSSEESVVEIKCPDKSRCLDLFEGLTLKVGMDKVKVSKLPLLKGDKVENLSTAQFGRVTGEIVVELHDNSVPEIANMIVAKSGSKSLVYRVENNTVDLYNALMLLSKNKSVRMTELQVFYSGHSSTAETF
ncbi:hypothetical protein ACFOEE_03470 [Pseudoalteromonas fenneropenaei]|uniref:Uncharacterized protein n=1 Tax=Pseudoalteromonas fenneropenaei TaxID=1737459 RepID=A0ABV7CG41_9GAMM